MTIELYDLPQGSPSITPAGYGTGYCTPSDVVSLNRARVLGTGGNPTLSDVQGYILMVAGQIDGALLKRGYQVPVNVASNPQVAGLLTWVNATGAWAMMESSAANSTNVDRAKAAFDQAMKMLVDSDLALDAPSDQQRAEVRAPFITYQPQPGVFDPMSGLLDGAPGDGISGGCTGQNRSKPFFARGMRF